MTAMTAPSKVAHDENALKAPPASFSGTNAFSRFLTGEQLITSKVDSIVCSNDGIEPGYEEKEIASAMDSMHCLQIDKEAEPSNGLPKSPYDAKMRRLASMWFGAPSARNENLNGPPPCIPETSKSDTETQKIQPEEAQVAKKKDEEASSPSATFNTRPDTLPSAIGNLLASSAPWYRFSACQQSAIADLEILTPPDSEEADSEDQDSDDESEDEDYEDSDGESDGYPEALEDETEAENSILDAISNLTPASQRLTKPKPGHRYEVKLYSTQYLKMYSERDDCMDWDDGFWDWEAGTLEFSTDLLDPAHVGVYDVGVQLDFFGPGGIGWYFAFSVPGECGAEAVSCTPAMSPDFDEMQEVKLWYLGQGCVKVEFPAEKLGGRSWETVMFYGKFDR